MKKYNRQYEQEARLLNEFLKRYPKEKYSQIYPDLYSYAFKKYCVENIFPLIKNIKGTKGLQKRAENTIKHITLGFSIFILLLLSFSFFLTILFMSGKFFAMTFSIIPTSFFIFFFAIVIYIINFAYKEREINQQIKNKILPKLFSLFSNCEYVISKEEKKNFKAYLSNLSLLKKRGGFWPSTCEDFFKLKYKGIDIDLCELTLSGAIVYLGNNKKVMHKGGSSIFYRIKTKKSFSSEIFIFKKIYSEANNNDTIKTITLESKEFNDLYVVKSTNQVESRTFITPAFMQRLIDFAKKNYHNELSISFENGYMNICFSAYMFSSFEIDDIKKANMHERIEKLRYAMIDLQEHLRIVDDLRVGNII